MSNIMPASSKLVNTCLLTAFGAAKFWAVEDRVRARPR